MFFTAKSIDYQGRMSARAEMAVALGLSLMHNADPETSVSVPMDLLFREIGTPRTIDKEDPQALSGAVLSFRRTLRRVLGDALKEGVALVSRVDIEQGEAHFALTTDKKISGPGRRSSDEQRWPFEYVVEFEPEYLSYVQTAMQQGGK